MFIINTMSGKLLTMNSKSINQGVLFNKSKNKQNKQSKQRFEGLDNMNMDPHNNVIQEEVIRDKNTNRSDDKDMEQLLQMQAQFAKLVAQYQKTHTAMESTGLANIARISSTNPYLNKYLAWSDPSANGTIMYVTSQGVAKPYTSWDIYESTWGVNGCPESTSIITVDLPWSTSYGVPGTIIPLTPSLIAGTPMTANETCSNAGKNVYASTLISNPTSSYIGCYNNQPPLEMVYIVPSMGNSGKVDGFAAYASSTYKNNYTTYGPWAAFDHNTDTFWNSSDDSTYAYDATTGVYLGTSAIPVKTKNSGTQTIKGEYIQINMPNVNTSSAVKTTITQYGLRGRSNCCFNSDGNYNGRDPNTWYLIGWDGSGWNEMNYVENYNFPSVGSYEKFPVTDTNEYSAFILIITVNGNDSNNTGERYSVQIASWNLYTSVLPDNGQDPAMTLGNGGNFADKKECETYALDNEYKYFGMQNYQSDGTAQCYVSNDITMAQSYGEASSTTTTMPIWSANISDGAKATFINGSITVLNSSGTTVFSTPNSTSPPSSYIGCYGDSSTRAMPMYNNGSQQYNKSECQQIAQENGATYYGLQNSTSGENAQCALSSNLTQTKEYGVASNCTQISDGSFSGGGWSNAVYNTIAPTDSNYYFILQDDGNMVIYKGSINDNQGTIWSSMSTGKQLQPNPNFAAAKGKYGTNWIPNGSTLGPGDFVGSTDGSIYLLMQTDGNLVLYTSSTIPGCVEKNNEMYGTEMINSLYQIDQNGYTNDLGKVAYVDQDLTIHEYPDSMISPSSDYNIYPGYDSTGNDLGSVSVTTMEDCTTACNNDNDCNGVVWQPGPNVCYLKNSSVYPISERQQNSTLTLGVRKPGLNSTTSCTDKIREIDTILYNNYTPGDAMTTTTECGAPIISINSADMNTYNELIGELETLGQQIATKMDKMYKEDTNLLNKMNLNDTEFKNDILKYKTIMKKIKNDSSSQSYTKEGMLNMDDINGMLNDTDLRVLQQNYRYILWSILAVGILTTTVHLLKK